MADSEWTRIFANYAGDLKEGDTWRLEFDDSVDPENTNPGWRRYIKKTSARFKCSRCKRSWPSNKVMVVFLMQLSQHQGVVKMRRFRQNCKKCTVAPMERPSISSDNITVLMESLMEKIRRNCYDEDLGELNRMFVRFDVKSPHEPSHCEACLAGICTQGSGAEP